MDLARNPACALDMLPPFDNPAVVTHATTVVQHPEVIAERIIRFADVVGREDVNASTECGSGVRSHPSVGWASSNGWPGGTPDLRHLVRPRLTRPSRLADVQRGLPVARR